MRVKKVVSRFLSATAGSVLSGHFMKLPLAQRVEGTCLLYSPRALLPGLGKVTPWII